jgi:hypothetical protein
MLVRLFQGLEAAESMVVVVGQDRMAAISTFAEGGRSLNMVVHSSLDRLQVLPGQAEETQGPQALSLAAFLRL